MTSCARFLPVVLVALAACDGSTTNDPDSAAGSGAAGGSTAVASSSAASAGGMAASTSSASGGAAGTGGAAGSGGGPGSGGAGGATTCAGEPTASACGACCEAASPQGYSAFMLIFYSCSCGNAANACGAECLDSKLCNAPSQPLSDACVGCLATHSMFSSAPCGTDGSQCAGDAGCNAFMGCIQSCPMP